MYCEKKVGSRRNFDRRSFRWITRGKTRILIACPRGKWKSRSQRCSVGTRAYTILTPATGRCRVGSRRIQKRR